MTSKARLLRERLASGAPLLFDGATGTELTRRGVDTGLPLWSAQALIEAPEVVRAIHSDYVRAGAEIITANTFRTHARSLAAGGLVDPDAAPELTSRAVGLAADAVVDATAIGEPGGEAAAAKEAGGEATAARKGRGEPTGIWVAGSVAPLEDCYSPELVPPDDLLWSEHEAMVENLVAAEVDLLLVETMNTVREAVAAATVATETSLPTIVGLVCGRDGRLLSGESVAEAAAVLEPLEPDAIVINCAPAPDLHHALAALRDATDLPIGAYGNVGYADDEVGWVNTDSVDPDAYARHAGRWLDLGARLIGSCCGTGPDHTKALRELIDARQA